MIQFSEEDQRMLRTVHEEQDLAVTRAAQEEIPLLTGRGIVTSIYDAEFASGWVLLSELARHQCKLPVEVFYMPGELSQKQIELLQSLPLDVRVKELPPVFKGFQIKPFAIHASEFREVMWIDADNAPVRDPTFLFDDPEYREKGSLFWRDVSGADRARFWHPGSVVWHIFNVPHNDSEEFETGQLLVDRTRCHIELALTRYFNTNTEFYYRFVYGDKDTFRMAWWQVHLKRGKGIRQINTLEVSADVPYGFMPYGPFHVGRVNPWKKWGGGSVMVQRDREGQPLFNHRTINKWKVDYDPTDPLDTPEDIIHRQHLDRLRERLR